MTSSLTSQRPTETTPALTRALLGCAIAMPIVLIGFAVWADAMTPGYSHIRSTVSQLAAQGRPHPAIMSTGFVIFGILGVGFATGLFVRLGTNRDTVVMYMGMLGFGIAMILTAFANDYDKVGDIPANFEGFLHQLCAGGAVIGLVIGMIFFVRSVYGDPDWAWTVRFSVGCAIAVTLTGMMFVLLPTIHQGLYQRLLFGVMLVWIVTIALKAMR